MNSNKLQARYTGAAAAKYDEKRKPTRRYHAEDAAFAKYFNQIKPQSVIDCPFGTGRWLDFYRNVNGPVIAVDLSDDMLAMARSKMKGINKPDIRYISGSVFDYDFGQYHDSKPDVLVCTRFLNWVNAKKAVEALSSLSKSGARWAIVGASVRPNEYSLPRRSWMKLRLVLENLSRRWKLKAVQHVHDENLALGAFQLNGWQIVERTHIFSNPTRENYFWLLKRALT